ncbi:zf-HC2 domain-containing protein [Nocardia sp. CDC159]|uniref:Zf-HC2 domain-containing protein n=1 Tax=Nocardia pulmonis TaxID=2951408 RepID=A0A9X2IVI3_9NOCA|nr:MULTISPECIES: zf-HC2 domain-containing protein [Nocardia]MCM6772494.1 zf-HC2 domain-containing protein [Nocardia pulmonis]MCM6784848.1 zf-HC2 domain-containing protein [Nocardia sp. CDC159]
MFHATANPGNFGGPRTDYCTVNCDVCREALSARIDGEPEPVPSAQVDRHLEECRACTDWYAAAGATTRTLRMRAAPVTPDLTDQILARAEFVGVTPRRRGLSTSALRMILLGIGAVQCALGLAQLVGHGVGVHAEHEVGSHLFNESTAWSFALGAGMVWGALSVRAVSGLIAVFGSFAAVVSVFVAHDLIGGQMSATRAESHVVLLAGLLVLVLLRRRAGGEPPEVTAEPGPLAMPPGARAGRRTGHLRSTHDPAA